MAYFFKKTYDALVLSALIGCSKMFTQNLRGLFK